jgi:repressor LexA
MEYDEKLIGKRLKEARLDKGFTLKELGKIVGLNDATLSRYERGNVARIKLPMIEALSSALKVDVLWLMGVSQKRNAENKSFENTSFYDFMPYSVAAGSTLEIPQGDCFNKIEIPDVFLGKHAGKKSILVTTVNGESMNKEIPNGSYIFVDRCYDDSESIKTGNIVLAKNCYGYTVKKFIKDNANDRFILKPNSTDESFADIVIDSDNFENFKIIGKLIGVYKNLD